MSPRADIRLEGGAMDSVLLVRPLSEHGRLWLEEHTAGTWWGGALAVENRYVSDLLEGAVYDGLSLCRGQS